METKLHPDLMAAQIRERDRRADDVERWMRLAQTIHIVHRFREGEEVGDLTGAGRTTKYRIRSSTDYIIVSYKLFVRLEPMADHRFQNETCSKTFFIDCTGHIEDPNEDLSLLWNELYEMLLIDRSIERPIFYVDRQLCESSFKDFF